jgi:hypothetical protein
VRARKGLLHPPPRVSGNCEVRSCLVRVPGDPFGEADRAPAWRKVHGIGHQWTPSPSGRRGCMLMLVAGLAGLMALLLVAVLVAVL